MNQPSSAHDALVYNVRDGFHEFIFANDRREAVEQLFIHIETIIHQTPPHELMLFLLDATHVERLPPFSTIFRKSREFDHKYSAVASPSRFAIVHQPGVLMSLIEGFVNTLSSYMAGRNQARFFKAGQHDAAVAWLLSQRE